MAQIEMFEFPAVAADWEAPTPLQRLLKIVENYGQIVTQSLLTKELGVSRARVSQLLAARRFETFIIEGETWVTVRSIEKYRTEEKRKGGRPRKQAA